MPPSEHGVGSEIGRATLICGWLFAAFSLLSVFISLRDYYQRNRVLGYDHCMLVVATAMSLALLIQTTWAIVVEGQGRHVQDESAKEIVMVVKVRFWYRRLHT